MILRTAALPMVNVRQECWIITLKSKTIQVIPSRAKHPDINSEKHIISFWGLVRSVTLMQFRSKKMSQKNTMAQQIWNDKSPLCIFGSKYSTFLTFSYTLALTFCLESGGILNQGRVVRKLVKVNPGLNVNWGITFSCLKISNVWCKLR